MNLKSTTAFLLLLALFHTASAQVLSESGKTPVLGISQERINMQEVIERCKMKSSCL